MARILVAEGCDKKRQTLVAGLRQRSHEVIVKGDALFTQEEIKQMEHLNRVDKDLLGVERMLKPPEFDLLIADDALELGWHTAVNSCRMAILLTEFYFAPHDEWYTTLAEELKQAYKVSELWFFYAGFNTATLIKKVQEMQALS